MLFLLKLWKIRRGSQRLVGAKWMNVVPGRNDPRIMSNVCDLYAPARIIFMIGNRLTNAAFNSFTVTFVCKRTCKLYGNLFFLIG